jgi:hypothetical protein
MRKALFCIAVTLSLLVLLCWAAGVDWRSPLAPEANRNWTGSEFRVVMGGAAQDEDRLRIGAVGENRTALQAIALNGVDAAENPILRYRFEQFPHTLELSLVFRRVGDDDVSVVTLPWPGDGDAYFDLGSVPEWQGRITEIAFAEFPTPQVVPPMQGFQPFTLVDATLSSRSWRGDLSALVTDWLGQWPWSQRSVHALGRDTDTPHAQSLVLCLAIAIAMLVLWTWLLLRVPRATLLRTAAIALVLSWIVLDLQWQSGLNWRHAATGRLYAEFDWPERELHSADSDVVAAAHQVQSAIRVLPGSSRVLVHAGSPFAVLRLVYHLLPMNVGVLALAHAAAPGEDLPDNSLVVLFDAKGWRYNEKTRVMSGDGLSITGDVIYNRGRVVVMRSRRSS